MALRLRIGDLWSKEPLDLGFAVLGAAAFRGVRADGTISIAVDGEFLWAIRVPLCVRVSRCLFKNASTTYCEFRVSNRINAS